MYILSIFFFSISVLVLLFYFGFQMVKNHNLSTTTPAKSPSPSTGLSIRCRVNNTWHKDLIDLSALTQKADELKYLRASYMNKEKTGLFVSVGKRLGGGDNMKLRFETITEKRMKIIFYASCDHAYGRDDIHTILRAWIIELGLDENLLEGVNLKEEEYKYWDDRAQPL